MIEHTFFLPIFTAATDEKYFSQNMFSSLLFWAAQMAHTEEFLFKNVAYRPSVYKTGKFTKDCLLITYRKDHCTLQNFTI